MRDAFALLQKLLTIVLTKNICVVQISTFEVFNDTITNDVRYTGWRPVVAVFYNIFVSGDRYIMPSDSIFR